jgi:hypothetical protein
MARSKPRLPGRSSMSAVTGASVLLAKWCRLPMGAVATSPGWSFTSWPSTCTVSSPSRTSKRSEQPL